MRVLFIYEISISEYSEQLLRILKNIEYHRINKLKLDSFSKLDVKTLIAEESKLSRQIIHSDVVIYQSVRGKNLPVILQEVQKQGKLTFILEEDNKLALAEILDKPKISLCRYGPNNIAELLEHIRNEIDSISTSKFIFVLPNSLSKYLNWAAEHKKLHKSDIVRNALQEMIREDKNYIENK